MHYSTLIHTHTMACAFVHSTTPSSIPCVACTVFPWLCALIHAHNMACSLVHPLCCMHCLSMATHAHARLYLTPHPHVLHPSHISSMDAHPCMLVPCSCPHLSLSPGPCQSMAVHAHTCLHPVCTLSYAFLAPLSITCLPHAFIHSCTPPHMPAHAHAIVHADLPADK